HWLDLAELLDAAGRTTEIDAALAAALRAATPPTPALMLAIGMRGVRAGETDGALRAFKDAIALEPVGARDDDARLDAAALVFVLAAERGDAATAANARALLGESTSATAAFWRGEALGALAEDGSASSSSEPSMGLESPAVRGEQSPPASHAIEQGSPVAISAVGALALRIVAMLEPDD